MSVYILFQKDNTISSWARAGYLKSTRQLSRWANGCGQDFSQLRDEQLATHLGNYHIHMGRCFLFRYCGNPEWDPGSPCHLRYRDTLVEVGPKHRKAGHGLLALCLG